jgi:mRNA-degrading endonuclease RelE of RelBE toxin-antitoxin system
MGYEPGFSAPGQVEVAEALNTSTANVSYWYKRMLDDGYLTRIRHGEYQIVTLQVPELGGCGRQVTVNRNGWLASVMCTLPERPGHGAHMGLTPDGEPVTWRDGDRVIRSGEQADEIPGSRYQVEWSEEAAAARDELDADRRRTVDQAAAVLGNNPYAAPSQPLRAGADQERIVQVTLGVVVEYAVGQGEVIIRSVRRFDGRKTLF